MGTKNPRPGTPAEQQGTATAQSDTTWHFQGIPEDNPIRKSAIFVVHGMGAQQYSDTAIQLRYGFEDALETIAGENKSNKLEPAPFIFEGYWANYPEIEKTFPDEWTKFTKGEKDFYGRLWKRRVMGQWRTSIWFVRQNFRVFQKKTIDDLGWSTGLALICMAPCTVIAAAVLSIKSPKIFNESLSDVRIYCNPQGSVERAMVERINRTVEERFLKLLGLDREFRTLADDDKLEISSQKHTFQYVTWIAHSLGSVISYNAVSNILHRIQEKESELKVNSAGRKTRSKEDLDLEHNIETVKTGLHRFYTIGSPLYYIYVLFPNALRPWELDSKDEIEKTGKNWWVNFFHAFDPVSMRLTSKPAKDGADSKKSGNTERLRRYFAIVEDKHSSLMRVPGKAHVDYWNDTNILKYIVSRTYGREICKHEPQFNTNGTGTFWRNFLMVFLAVFILAALAAAVLWIAFGGGLRWLGTTLLKWVKDLF